jgi:hypothetical protein
MKLNYLGILSESVVRILFSTMCHYQWMAKWIKVKWSVELLGGSLIEL